MLHIKHIRLLDTIHSVLFVRVFVLRLLLSTYRRGRTQDLSSACKKSKCKRCKCKKLYKYPCKNVNYENIFFFHFISLKKDLLGKTWVKIFFFFFSSGTPGKVRSFIALEMSKSLILKLPMKCNSVAVLY